MTKFKEPARAQDLGRHVREGQFATARNCISRPELCASGRRRALREVSRGRKYLETASISPDNRSCPSHELLRANNALSIGGTSCALPCGRPLRPCCRCCCCSAWPSAEQAPPNPFPKVTLSSSSSCRSTTR